MVEPLFENTTKEFWEPLVEQHESIRGIATFLGCSETPVRRILNKLGVEYDHRALPLTVRHGQDIVKALEEQAEKLTPFRDRLVQDAKTLSERWDKTYKLLMISDLHGFFAREDLVDRALQLAKDMEPKELPVWVAILGDIFNFDIFSMFMKYYGTAAIEIQARVETLKMERIFKKILDSCERLLLIAGNHDARGWKTLCRSIGAQAAEFVAENAPVLGWALHALGSEAFMPGLAPEERNKIDIAPAHFQRIGDIFLAHPHRFSGRVKMRTAEWFDEWLMQRVVRPYKGVCVGHSHRLGTDYGRAGILLAEIGTMCDPMPYTIRDTAAGAKSKWYMGCAIVPIIDGKARLDDLIVKKLDEEYLDV